MCKCLHPEFLSFYFTLQVLSDTQKRALYDQFGEDGLKSTPVPTSSPQPATRPQPYTYNHRSAEEIFAEFFSKNPFNTSGGGEGSTGGSSRAAAAAAATGNIHVGGERNKFTSGPIPKPGVQGSPYGGTPPGADPLAAHFAEAATLKQKKPPPVETKLLCSLEDLYKGGTKKMKISRTVVDKSGYVSRLNCG